ncbi:MAG: M48 family metallopeptidase [Gemmatimonadaceae bacterium]
MKRLMLAPAMLLTGAVATATLSTRSEAQSTVRRSQSSFNLFSVQQDVEIGRQAAVEAERQLPLLNDRQVNNYLNRVIQRLATHAPGADYPYQIKAVNATEINAFALPGGPMYVNRGLIASARSEAELVGVLAHEMAHVALRHGTTQASKAYLGQTGLSLLGGLLGRSSSTSRIVNAVGGFGLNAAFLKFSRDDEYEADATGADIMARAGYDPAAMADFFAFLRQEQRRDPSKLERFFSSHPPPADRESRIRELASTLSTTRSGDVGGFAAIQSRVGNTALASAQTQWPTTTSTGTVTRPIDPVTVSVPAPSSSFTLFQQPNGFFTISRPSNWRAFASSGFAVSLAPTGGVLEMSDGQPVMAYGMIINHYAPFTGTTERRSRRLQRSYVPFEDRVTTVVSLEEATDDLVNQIVSTNSYLSAEPGSARALEIDGARGYLIVLNGRSPVTADDERVSVYTRELGDGHVLYALCVAPGREWATVDATCGRMLSTLRVNDEAAHRSTTSRPRAIRP